MYQNRYERDTSRDRSRDRDRKYHNKSPSEDSNEYRKYRHSTRDQKQNKQIKSKRVKFEQNLDIKVFRKEDEPNAKGLSQEEILKIKSEFEKQIAKSYDFNWEHYKHRDAQLQSNSMKEQKQRQKMLNEKLMNVKQGMVFVNPLRIRNVESIIEIGVDSLQKEAHTARIQHVLGCYYTHLSQIPNQPQFQILNTNNTSECKIIKFDNETFNNDLALGNNTKKNNENLKPLKGILKTHTPTPIINEPIEPRTINPNLIYLLKDIKLNPTNYTKEKTEQLLKPYKESGELQYLTKNKDVLQKMLKSTSAPPPSTSTFVKQPFTPSSSAGRQSHDRQPSYSNQPPMINPAPHMGGYGHTFVPKADKYRTVPCKYYHGPQGCNKIDNCTYIHDERYPGVPVPITQPPINQGGQGMPKMPMNYMQNPGGYNPYPNTNMPNMPSTGNQPSGMGHPGYMMGGNMPYQGGNNYYNNPPPSGSGYSGGYAPNPYMRGQYNPGPYNNPGYPPYYNNPQNPQNPPKQ